MVPRLSTIDVQPPKARLKASWSVTRRNVERLGRQPVESWQFIAIFIGDSMSPENAYRRSPAACAPALSRRRDPRIGELVPVPLLRAQCRRSCAEGCRRERGNRNFSLPNASKDFVHPPGSFSGKSNSAARCGTVRRRKLALFLLASDTKKTGERIVAFVARELEHSFVGSLER